MRTDVDAPGADQQQDATLRWWHRDHPVFTPLAGFFSGLVFVSLVPALFVALTRAVLDDETAEAVFPFVLVLLAVPIGLAITERTRRFGAYMLLGILITALVVVGVATLVLWVLLSREG